MKAWRRFSRIFPTFSKFKVHGLDIATLLGAKGPQQGPQGPKGPEGPPSPPQIFVSGFRILKKIWNRFTNEGARAISVRGCKRIATNTTQTEAPKIAGSLGQRGSINKQTNRQTKRIQKAPISTSRRGIGAQQKLITRGQTRKRNFKGKLIINDLIKTKGFQGLTLQKRKRSKSSSGVTTQCYTLALIGKSDPRISPSGPDLSLYWSC